jgi:4-alpha-glucanotransferase
VHRKSYPHHQGTSALHELAESCGVQVSYEDVSGKRCEACPDSIVAALSLLGTPIHSLQDVPNALRERRIAEQTTCLEPVVLAWDGAATQTVLRLPAREATGLFTCQIEEEMGTTHKWEERIEGLSDSPDNKEAQEYVAKTLDVPGGLTLGYHRLRVQFRERQHDALLIAAPYRAYSPRGNGWERTWGAFLPLYALHSESSWGAGDFSDLSRLREWIQNNGAGIVGTLPLLPAFFNEAFEISPYSPVSRLFWNEFYLDVERIPELASAPAARQLLENSSVRAEINALRSARHVDYRRTMELKRSVLNELAKFFIASSSGRRNEFEAYKAKHPRLADYAQFRATGENLQKPWPEWPDEMRDGSTSNLPCDDEKKQYHMYVQWVADEQLRAAAGDDEKSGLYLDLPLGVNANGYDVWRERSLFAVGAAGGAPPDVVFPKGQNWGFVPLHPGNIRKQGYQYIRDFLHHQMWCAKVLRIDHVPSFHRVFWIPPGAEARDGVYVRYPAEELYAVFNLESHRHQTMLVGEDLGTVPPEVPRAMARHNVHRMYVVEYELKPDHRAALPEPPASSMASVNTHDMPPFAGYWEAHDVEEFESAGLLPADKCEEQMKRREKLRSALQRFLQSAGYVDGQQSNSAEIYNACLAFLRDSPARMVLLNLEDLWSELESQNVPSTSGENQNWRRKARYTLEQMKYDPVVNAIFQQLTPLSRCSRQDVRKP